MHVLAAQELLAALLAHALFLGCTVLCELCTFDKLSGYRICALVYYKNAWNHLGWTYHKQLVSLFVRWVCKTSVFAKWYSQSTAFCKLQVSCLPMARKWYHKLSYSHLMFPWSTQGTPFPPFWWPKSLYFMAGAFLWKPKQLQGAQSFLTMKSSVASTWAYYKKKDFPVAKREKFVACDTWAPHGYILYSPKGQKSFGDWNTSNGDQIWNFGASSVHGYFSWELNPEVWWLFKEDWYHILF